MLRIGQQRQCCVARQYFAGYLAIIDPPYNSTNGYDRSENQGANRSTGHRGTATGKRRKTHTSSGDRRGRASHQYRALGPTGTNFETFVFVPLDRLLAVLNEAAAMIKSNFILCFPYPGYR